jgi:hypothetical protein
VIAPEDVAMYGGFCALATFDREELKSKVMDSPAFKGFLDLVPKVGAIGADDAHPIIWCCVHKLWRRHVLSVAHFLYRTKSCDL